MSAVMSAPAVDDPTLPTLCGWESSIESIRSRDQPIFLDRTSLRPDDMDHDLGKLKIFAGIWQFPSRIKCAGLAGHAMNGALANQTNPVCTEKEEGQ